MKIESPLSNFNNILNEVTNNIENLLFKNSKNYLTCNNQIIFDNESIIILGYIKIGTVKNSYTNLLHLKITKPINKDEFELINNIYNNWDELSLNYFRYIQMYNLIVNNYDEIPNQIIDEIINHIKKSLKNKSKIDNFLIPYKNKITNLYDSEKAYLFRFYNKFEYILKINRVSTNKIEYCIFRVLSSELSENKNELNNIRYMEQDLIKKNQIQINQINDFITKLFCYGELIG